MNVIGLQAVLSAEEAAKYTYEDVILDSDNWNPKAFFESVNAPADLRYSGNVLGWKKSAYAISYVVFNGDEVIGFTKETTFTDSSVSDCATGKYTVKAVNEYGSLSASSDPAVEGVINLVEEVITNSVKVTRNADIITVENITNGDISIFGIDGALIMQKSVSGNSGTLNISALKGIYILKAGNESIKMIF